MCMFLKHVKTVRLSIWHPGEAAPSPFCLARAEDDDATQAALIPEILSSPDVLSELARKFEQGERIQANFVRTITRDLFGPAQPAADGIMPDRQTKESVSTRYLVSTCLATDTNNPACMLALEQGKAGGLRLLPLGAYAGLPFCLLLMLGPFDALWDLTLCSSDQVALLHLWTTMGILT